MIQRLQESSPKKDQETGSVSDMCALLEVSRSGYYAHLHKAERARRQQDQELGRQIEAIFEASRESYGSPRLVAWWTLCISKACTVARTASGA